MKLTLRKAAAVGQEVRRQLSNQIRLATDTRTVNLRAISTVTTAEAVQAAEEDRSALLGKLETLQAISTKIRRAIAEGNIQFGVNEILHKLRETEDLLEVKTAFFVDTAERQRSVRRGNSYDSLEECELAALVTVDAVPRMPSATASSMCSPRSKASLTRLRTNTW